MLEVVVFFVAVWYFSLFCQTFFHHRYAAHGAFTMSKGWERFFFVLSYITQGPSYLSPRAYALMHRMHHAYADTELDPHSPNFSSNLFSMMWRTKKFYTGIFDGTMEVEKRFEKNVPDWKWFDRWANSWPARLIWIGLYVAFFYAYATSVWAWLFFPFILIMSPMHGAIINWFAHKYGYRNFKMKNTSENLLFFDFLMLGESYHNNHHKHPSSVNFGYRWHEIDPVYPVILLLNKLRVIRLSSPLPEEENTRTTAEENAKRISEVTV